MTTELNNDQVLDAFAQRNALIKIDLGGGQKTLLTVRPLTVKQYSNWAPLISRIVAATQSGKLIKDGQLDQAELEGLLESIGDDVGVLVRASTELDPATIPTTLWPYVMRGIVEANFSSATRSAWVDVVGSLGGAETIKQLANRSSVESTDSSPADTGSAKSNNGPSTGSGQRSASPSKTKPKKESMN